MTRLTSSLLAQALRIAVPIKRSVSSAAILAGAGLCAAFLPSEAGAITTIYTIGDSTVSPYTAAQFPQSGSGQQLGFFFNSANVVVVDKAIGGTSSKSYCENFWTPVKNGLKPGDFVTIQFGINDAAADVARHTVPFTTFTDFLKKFIAETRAKGAFPILVSTQNRNAWSPTDPTKVYPAYHDYPVATRQLAADTSINVPFVDLDRSCTALLESLQIFYVTHFIYLHTEPGEYPRFPTGHDDAVHFQESGAIEMARLIATGIGALGNDVNVKKLIPSLVPTFPVTFTANTSNGGAVTRSQSFPAGIRVTAKALPASGIAFSGWSGGLSGTDSTVQFIMSNAPKSIMANFSNGPFGGPGGGKVFEAESALISPGVSESINAGFTGTGYANTDNVSGAFVEWTVTTTAAGNYSLKFRFANGSAADRPADLRVNGALLRSGVSFPATGAFTTWSDVTLTSALVAGTNKIRLTATTTAGCANLDNVTVSP